MNQMKKRTYIPPMLEELQFDKVFIAAGGGTDMGGDEVDQGEEIGE